MKKEKQTYGFLIGEQRVTAKAEDEQKALILVVKEWWHLIDKANNIELLGREVESK